MSNARKQLIFFGGRPDGGVKTILDLVESENAYEFLGFADDHLLAPQLVEGYPILGAVQAVIEKYGRLNAAFAVPIGSNAARARIFAQARAAGLAPINLIHPTCVISRRARLGTGCLLFPRVVVNGGARVGDNVILNTGAIVEHDNEIEDHANLCPGVITAGRVRIREGAYVGTGAVVLPDVEIGKNAVVGAGAIVVKNVFPDTTVMGVPARAQERNSSTD
jgi:sugar O-acyltransferase (sialic acid O-acetyltransferase NeuD family)